MASKPNSGLGSTDWIFKVLQVDIFAGVQLKLSHFKERFPLLEVFGQVIVETSY